MKWHNLMKRHIEVWQPALVIWVVLLILRGGMLTEAFTALPGYTASFMSGGFFNHSMPACGFIMTELIGFMLLPFVVLMGRKKLRFLKSQLKVYNFSGIILLYLLLFAGIITDRNPDFQKDLSLTKLLPPFSSVSVLHLNAGTSGEKEKLLAKESFDESIVFIDSIRFDHSWKYFQKNSVSEISADKIEFKDGKPLVTKMMFLLGSDQLGRDVFTRLVFGARTSLSIGICASVLSFLIGVIFGFMAGYYEGAAGMLLSRTVDVLLSFPIIILIILVVALFGNSMIALVLTLGLTGWMGLFKIIKSELLVIKTKDYFITSRMIGLNNMQLIIKEALPVFIIPAVTNLVFQINNVIIAESSLSYLGLGVGNLYPSWGAMIHSGQEYITNAWWLLLFPGLMIILALQSVKGFGNRINSYFYTGLLND